MSGLTAVLCTMVLSAAIADRDSGFSFGALIVLAFVSAMYDADDRRKTRR